jgi:lipopolysaccharide export system permease protein
MKISRLKRLHVLILKSFIGPFVLVFFIVLFILLMQFLWRYIDELVGKGLEIKVIAELLMYTAASLVPMALPLAILMSSLMTFGNMGEFYELTAIKASGISLQRIIMPLVVLVFFIGIGAFEFANDVLPYTNLKMRSLLYDVRKQRPEILIMPGSFYNGMEGYSIRAEKKNSATNVLYDIKIYDHTAAKGNTSVIIADSGSMIVTTDKHDLILTLYDGYSYNELQEEKSNRNYRTYPHRYDKFKEQQIIITLVGFDLERTDESLWKSQYQMLNLSQLGYMRDSVKTEIVKRYDQLSTSLIKGNFLPGFVQSRRRPPNDRLIQGTQKLNNIANLQGLGTTKIVLQPEKKSVVPDTLNKQTSISRSMYDFLDRMTPAEKDEVLNTALAFSRNSRSFVVSSIESVDYKVKLLRRYEIEWHRKFTIAFACFVFLLIGAPLGAIIRKGGLGLPLVISTLLFIFYYMISLTGEKFVRESYLPGYEGMWISSGIFFVVGVFLTYKATRDASILSFEAYSNFIKKFIKTKKVDLPELLKKEGFQQDHLMIKKENLYPTLLSFLDSINEQENIINNQLKIGGFLVSLVGITEDSDIILFERLYKNIVNSLLNSDLMEIPPVRSKILDFPNFNYRAYTDIEERLYLRLALLLLPPITLIVIGRQYVRLLMFKARLKTIYNNTIDILTILKKTIAED